MVPETRALVSLSLAWKLLVDVEDLAAVLAQDIALRREPEFPLAALDQT